MKIIKKYIVLSLLVVLGITFSCQDMNEIHQDYIKNGELKYTNKVDSLTTFSGNGRVKISGFISGAFNVDEIVVTWNKGTDSKSFPYAKSVNDTDSLNLQVSGLEEGSYEFKIYSKDAEGNKSVPITAFGTAYGESYRSTLEARVINTFSFGHDFSAAINFKPSTDITRNTEVKYMNLSGQEVVKALLTSESTLEIEQVDRDQPIMYRTLYVPTPKDEEGNETAIDEFGSDWETYEFPSVISSIFPSITLVPISGGVIANWENSKSILMTFTFINNDKQDQEVINSLTSSESVGTYSFTAMKSEEQEIKIKISDIYGNSQTMAYTVTPLPAAGKGNWTIVDFSSEEAGGEGPVNGYATAAIDGDIATFWHSKWSGSGSTYPHHLTVDMGSEKRIAGFQIFRRSGNSGGATVHEFWVSSDNVTFTKVATLNAALNTNNGFLVNADAITTGRYVKYVATAGPSNFTYLGELNVSASLDKSDWSIVDFSSQHDPRPATNIIDGDISTFWHSDWAVLAPPYPHHITVDMGVEKTITGFELFRRPNSNTGHTKHQFFVSTDNINWTDLGMFNMDPNTNDGQVNEIPSMPTARYFKYVAIEGPNHYDHLAEINVFGLIE